MRIQHNINAMNTHRQLNINNSSQAKSTEKLSSGYRINRAADDAAGLTISEKMRAQIRGLEMASKNAQDGISLIQAAEGALQETHDILQRMRELAVQAANDVNEIEDRDAVQAELDQLTSEIDRIAYTTEFNKKTLLDGSLSSKASGRLSSGTKARLVDASAGVAGTYAITVSTVAAKHTGTITIGGAATTDGVLTIGGGVLTDAVTVEIKNGQSAAEVASNALVALMQNEEFTRSFEATVAAGVVTIKAKEFGPAPTTAFTASSTATGATATWAQTTAGAYAVIAGASVDTNGVYTHTTGGFKFTLDQSLAAGATDISFTISNGKELTLQVGANTGTDQTIAIGINSLSAAGLGITSIKVDSHDNAQTAVDAIESAIQLVSKQRSSLGAVQNRLEHTVKNLDTVNENLTAAESRIRDVDMAKEMMAYTKNNILTQAATAMLAQANQQPQTVLQLLQ